MEDAPIFFSLKISYHIFWLPKLLKTDQNFLSVDNLKVMVKISCYVIKNHQEKFELFGGKNSWNDFSHFSSLSADFKSIPANIFFILHLGLLLKFILVITRWGFVNLTWGIYSRKMAFRCRQSDSSMMDTKCKKIYIFLWFFVVLILMKTFDISISTRVKKNISKQLSRSRFSTGFEIPRPFPFKSRKKSCSWKLQTSNLHKESF